MLLVSTNIKTNTGRNLSHGNRTCSHIETNNTKLCPTRANLVSKTRKKSQPVEKRFSKKMCNGIAHFITPRAWAQNNKFRGSSLYTLFLLPRERFLPMFVLMFVKTSNTDEAHCSQAQSISQ